MSETQQIRLGAWAGIANLLLSLAVLLTTRHSWKFWPVRGDTDAEYAAWFHRYSAGGFAQTFSTNIGALLGIWFAFALTRALRLPQESLLSFVIRTSATVIVPGMLVVNAMFSVASTPQFIDDPHSWPLLRAFTEACLHTFYGLLSVFAFLLLAAAVAVRRTRELPAWTGWTALAAGIVTLAGSAVSLVRSGWLAPLSLPSVTPFFLYWLWVTAVSVAMLRLPPRDLPTASGQEPGSGAVAEDAGSSAGAGRG
ncbi:hypothetical protein [Actinacidiphila acidipaludis]|uniref:DUF998 domain-containing protein n=1 Tax=Actinacidiphila acidipaludis TaxID=2873382 RepID=A0ABS7QIN0_9ACTN|nr:hypothetical protein [Streptomyces acidipaludis]MBY8883033.1 hypothetical protein [Streptomyces acidipaludis]